MKSQNRILRVIGKILMLVSILFIARKIWEYKVELGEYINRELILQMVISTLIYSMFVLLLPFIYKRTLTIATGYEGTYIKIAELYCTSNIMKYLPGNVMQYIGRNKIAVDEGLEHKKVAWATFLEICITVLSSIVLISLFSVGEINGYTFSRRERVIGIFLCIGSTIFLGKIHKNKIWDFIEILGINIFINCGVGFLFHAFLMVNTEISIGYAGEIIGGFSLAFLVGYLIPGAPGGIGVREFVLIQLFAEIVSEKDILVLSICFRLVSVFADLLAYIIVGLYVKYHKNRRGKNG